MGEIKSTLDLVMERTRHMSLSAEEKTLQKRDDFKKRLQGLLNKYIDGALSVHALKDQIEVLQAEMKLYEKQIISEAVFTSIDPDKDNKRRLDLIDILFPDAREPIRNIIEEYQKQKADNLRFAKKRVLNQLAENYTIKGSAVLPNTDNDVQYQKDVAALRLYAQKKIEAVSRSC